MSLLGSLMPKRGSTKRRKVVGRGRGSGHGGTATKGHKGQTARSGGSIRRGFEGGQTPLSRRMPKVGFTNTEFKTVYQIVNLSQLEAFSSEVTPEILIKAGLVKKGYPVKILGQGELKKSLTVKANKFSNKAKSTIETLGGKAEVI